MELPVSLLIQIPLVGIFIWFVITMTGKMTEFVDKRDQQWREIISSQTQVLNDLSYQVSRNTAILLLLYQSEGKDDTARNLINEILRDVRGKVDVHEPGKERN